MKPTDKYSKLNFDLAFSVLSYDKNSGDLFWKVSNNQKRKNSKAGYKTKSGYRMVKIFGKNYLCHRIVWLMHYGSWPHQYIDHIDGNKENNHIGNLREANHSENKKNEKLRKDNLLRIKGVQLHGSGKYRARIFANGKHISLGLYGTAKEAHQAYISAAKKFHGEFMRAK